MSIKNNGIKSLGIFRYPPPALFNSLITLYKPYRKGYYFCHWEQSISVIGNNRCDNEVLSTRHNREVLQEAIKALALEGANPVAPLLMYLIDVDKI